MGAPITNFIQTHYRHFNAGALRRAAVGYKNFVEKQNGKMMVTLAGAMSTAELGILLAEMIRKDKIAAITCTGANLEEDLFNAVAHEYYREVPNYRDLSPQDEQELLNQQFNRVTDTCIPEEEAMRRIEQYVIPLWEKASLKNNPRLPHEFMYEIALDPKLQAEFQIPKQNSWLVAAAEKNLPLFVPGWEDSSLGNMLVALKHNKRLELNAVKSGLYYMDNLINWYQEISQKHPMGFFQIGGGTPGDFSICVVPTIIQDIKDDCPMWQYFCQITDAVESYGGYSGAAASEKITWGKLTTESERHNINSDATIVAPLIFSYVLGM
ncbi:MAG: deoxyhypusine synthase family protein [Alphaproteobacteria bacterium]